MAEELLSILRKITYKINVFLIILYLKGRLYSSKKFVLMAVACACVDFYTVAGAGYFRCKTDPAKPVVAEQANGWYAKPNS